MGLNNPNPHNFEHAVSVFPRSVSLLLNFSPIHQHTRMKLTYLAYTLAPFAAFALAASDSLSKADIATNVVFPDSTNPKKLPEFINDKETNVQFQFQNNEDTAVHIAGYFGSFFYNKKGVIEKTPYANLTTSKIGPLAIEPGKNATFDAKIMVNLPPEDFDLILSFFVGHQGDVVIVENKPLKVTISDPPISFFDPKFLFIQLVFGLTIGAIGYAVVTLGLIPYLDQSPAASKKSTASSKKPIPEKKSVNPGEKGYDESWIPTQHLQQKSKKAN